MDAILNIYSNVTAGLVVYEKVIHRRVMDKLPFMATENVMMESVKRGGDRQQLHEIIRVHSHEAAAKVKIDGGQNDLIDRMADDDRIPLSKEEILQQLDPNRYIGRSAEQVDEFLSTVAQPLLKRYYTGDVAAALTL